jgi:hypothetical protein
MAKIEGTEEDMGDEEDMGMEDMGMEDMGGEEEMGMEAPSEPEAEPMEAGSKYGAIKLQWTFTIGHDKIVGDEFVS